MINHVMEAMISYFNGDVKRINHALKVYCFAQIITEGCTLDETQARIVSCTAILHDIGIHEAERKHHSSGGRYQEIEGPSIARELLSKFDMNEGEIDRICYIIGNHHTYSNIDGIDFQILVEADFLVNIFEDSMSPDAVRKIKETIFKTQTGISLLQSMYL